MGLPLLTNICSVIRGQSRLQNASKSLILVLVKVAPPHTVLGCQVVRTHRATAAVGVELRRHLPRGLLCYACACVRMCGFLVCA